MNTALDTPPAAEPDNPFADVAAFKPVAQDAPPRLVNKALADEIALSENFPSRQPASVETGRVESGLPWSGASKKMKVIYGVRMPEELHAKLAWLAKNTVNNSMHTIALSAIEDRIEAMLASMPDELKKAKEG